MSIYLNEKAEARVSIVVLTYNRRARVLGLLRRLQALAGDWPIIVVDNGSMDGTAAAVAAAFPSVLLIRAKRNLGAAARNIGAAYVHTPYIAFCDDYMQWEPDALERGVRLLDGAPDVAVLSSRIWKDGDPAGDEGGGARHPAFQGFLAGACMVRTRAFCDVGGYWPPLFNGGEEVLMALDLVERGWRIVYAADVVARSLSSRREEADARNRLLLRNVIWVAWMRLPMRAAWRITAQQLRCAYRRRCLCRTALGAIAGLPRVLSHRQVVSAAAQQMKPTLGF